jgi:hypothetical protein
MSTKLIRRLKYKVGVFYKKLTIVINVTHLHVLQSEVILLEASKKFFYLAICSEHKEVCAMYFS